MDFSTRLRGINPTNTVFYSPQPRAEVYCLLMNFKISKLANSVKSRKHISQRMKHKRSTFSLINILRFREAGINKRMDYTKALFFQ